ncbi:MAG: oligosaccharide flippase family protein [Dysgonomonas sp.]
MNIRCLKCKVADSRILKDSFWAVFGNVIAKGLSLIAGIVVARLLGKDIFGEYGMIKNTLATMAIFSTFGLGYTATKYVAEFKNVSASVVSQVIKYSTKITLCTSGLMAVIIFVFANYISNTILKAPDLGISLKLTAIWVVFNALTTTQIGILSGFGSFKGMARVNTYIGVFIFFFSIILTYLWGLEGALFTLLLGQMLNFYLNYRLVKKNEKEIDVKVESSLSLVSIPDLLKFSFPVALQEVLFSITGWVVSLLLVRLSTYGELGSYSAALQWYILVLYIPGVLRNVVLTHLSENLNNDKIYSKILNRILLINFLSTLIPFIIIFAFSGFIASFYGTSFQGIGLLISLATLNAIPACLSNVYAQAYMSKGKNWLMLVLRLIRDVSFIGISYYLIVNNSGDDGAMNLVIASLITSALFLFLVVIIYRFFVD